MYIWTSFIRCDSLSAYDNALPNSYFLWWNYWYYKIVWWVHMQNFLTLFDDFSTMMFLLLVLIFLFDARKYVALTDIKHAWFVFCLEGIIRSTLDLVWGSRTGWRSGMHWGSVHHWIHCCYWGWISVGGFGCCRSGNHWVCWLGCGCHHHCC